MKDTDSMGPESIHPNLVKLNRAASKLQDERGGFVWLVIGTVLGLVVIGYAIKLILEA